jgi:hypothetical protein
MSANDTDYDDNSLYTLNFYTLNVDVDHSFNLIFDKLSLIDNYVNPIPEDINPEHISIDVSFISSNYKSCAEIITQLFNNINDNYIYYSIVEKFLLKYGDPEYIYSFLERIKDKYNISEKQLVVHINNIFKYLNINIKNYPIIHDEMGHNKIYRLIVGTNLSIDDKIKLYCLDNCKTIYLNDKEFFYKGKIYDLQRFINGDYFTIQNTNNFNLNIAPYTYELYDKKLLKFIINLNYKINNIYFNEKFIRKFYLENGLVYKKKSIVLDYSKYDTNCLYKSSNYLYNLYTKIKSKINNIYKNKSIYGIKSIDIIGNVSPYIITCGALFCYIEILLGI